MELQRQQVTAFPAQTACVVCGKLIKLWLNDDQLSHVECCDTQYSLEHVRIDLVVWKAEPSVGVNGRH